MPKLHIRSFIVKEFCMKLICKYCGGSEQRMIPDQTICKCGNDKFWEKENE